MIDLRYIGLLLRLVFVGASQNPMLFFGMSVTMFIQNLMFFLFWVVFFSGIQDIGGWGLAQVALFQGVAVAGIGIAFLFANGARWIANIVISGEMDIYLARPRDTLLQVLTLHSDPSTMGDIAYGILLVLAFGHLGAGGLLMALICALCIAVLFVAVSVLFDCLIFYIGAGREVSQTLFRTVMTLSTIPQHTQGVAFKLVLYTVLPAGFMVILPVEAVRQESLHLIAVLIAASGAYMAAAVVVFRRGLKRYTSATGWSA